MSDPIGKKLYQQTQASTIVGIIKDFHITAPTEPVQPYVLVARDILKGMGFSIGKGQILIKFHDGKWKELKQQIDSIFSQEYPEVRYRLFNTEEEYRVSEIRKCFDKIIEFCHYRLHNHCCFRYFFSDHIELRTKT